MEKSQELKDPSNSSFTSTGSFYLNLTEEDENKDTLKIKKDDKLIIASFKLPIEVYKDEKGKWATRDSPVI